jgi:hypothetical protein
MKNKSIDMADDHKKEEAIIFCFWKHISQPFGSK